MEPEDLEPRHKKPTLLDLTQMGIAELEDYIGGLEAEIARARAAINAKKASRGAADSVFKR